MSPIQIKIPGEDAWIIERLGRSFTWRLVHGQDSPTVRQSLIRFLFGLQRLPTLIPDLCLSLRVAQIYVEINSTLLGIESFTDDGHTEFRLQYFKESNHCLHWNEFLVGEDKRDAIEIRLQELETDFTDGAPLMIEDHSTGDFVDIPPLDDYMEYALSYEAS